MIYLRVLLIFCLLPLLAVNGQPETYQPGHDERISYSLILDDCQLDENSQSALRDGATFLQKQFMDAFQFDFPPKLPVKIRVFEDFLAFKFYQMGVSHAQSNVAYFSARYNEAVIFKRKRSKQLFRYAYHELTHLFFRNIQTKNYKEFKNRPLWLSEGLAEYYETMEVHPDRVEILPQKTKENRCVRWLAADSLTDLRTYLNWDFRNWKKSETVEGEFYSRTIGWSLVYFLMSSHKGKLYLRDIIKYLANNQHLTNGSVKAINHVYPGGLAKLEAEWKAWIPLEHPAHTYFHIEVAGTLEKDAIQGGKREKP